MKQSNHSNLAVLHNSTVFKGNCSKTQPKNGVKPPAIPQAGVEPFPANSGTPGEQKVKVSTTPKRGGVIFRSPLTGTVLADTAAFHTVETLATPLGTLVTTVDRFNWREYGGLKYWVGSESPSIPADQCECKAGDLISWFGAAG